MTITNTWVLAIEAYVGFMDIGPFQKISNKGCFLVLSVIWLHLSSLCCSISFFFWPPSFPIVYCIFQFWTRFMLDSRFNSALVCEASWLIYKNNNIVIFLFFFFLCFSNLGVAVIFSYTYKVITIYKKKLLKELNPPCWIQLYTK